MKRIYKCSKKLNKKSILLYVGFDFFKDWLCIPADSYYMIPKVMVDCQQKFIDKFGDIIWIGPDFGSLIELSCLGLEPRVEGSGLVFPTGFEQNELLNLKRFSFLKIHQSKWLDLIWEYYKDAQPQLEEEYFFPVSITGPFQLACQLFGSKKIFQLVMSNYLELNLYLKYLTQYLISYIKEICSLIKTLKIDLMICDDMVGYLGDSVFKDLVLPYLVELYAVVKPNHRIFHSDGTLQWIWKTICKEVDVLFSFDPSLDIDKIRQENKDIFLIGNIDPVKIMLEGKSEEIAKISWEKIRAGGKNFALGLGGELVSGTPEENIKVIAYLQDEF